MCLDDLLICVHRKFIACMGHRLQCEMPHNTRHYVSLVRKWNVQMHRPFCVSIKDLKLHLHQSSIPGSTQFEFRSQT